jgi:hypothetical protein
MSEELQDWVSNISQSYCTPGIRFTICEKVVLALNVSTVVNICNRYSTNLVHTHLGNPPILSV